MSNRYRHVIAAVVAIMCTSCAALGWKLNVFALYLLGLPGALIALSITGPHGGSHREEVIGGYVFIVANLLIDWFVAELILNKISRKRRD